MSVKYLSLLALFELIAVFFSINFHSGSTLLHKTNFVDVQYRSLKFVPWPRVKSQLKALKSIPFTFLHQDLNKVDGHVFL
jgi:hypothetical protein